jgi:hypothetical protein
MVIGMLVEMNNLDEKKYDRIQELMNVRQNPAKGMLLHAAGPIPGGWRVFSIWESKELVDQFLQERVQPAFKQLGLTWQPARQDSFPIHNLVAPNPSMLNKFGAVGAGQQR